MKKTLIALMALAGVAMADSAWTFDSMDVIGTTSSNTGITIIDSGLIAGTQLGAITLTQSMGNAAHYTTGSYSYLSDNLDIVKSLGVSQDKQQSYTLMAYVKFDNVTGEKYFFGTGNSHNNGLGLGVQDGKVSFLTKTEAHNTGWNCTISANTWYHLAYAYDSTANSLTLFVNGESKGAITFDNNCHGDGWGDPNECLMFGASATQQAAFAGAIAQLEIHDGVAMNAAQVIAAAAAPATPSIPEPATATLSLLALAGLASRRRRK